MCLYQENVLTKFQNFRKEVGRGQRVFSLQWDLEWQKSPKT